MTNSRRFRRSCSLRGSKSPSLLDSASRSFYNPLEEADPAKGPRGTVVGQSSLVFHTGGAPEISAQSKGNRRRATSLRVRKVGGEGGTTLGEAAHSLGHDDGQLLLGEAHGSAGSKMKKCKKEVHRAFREGWETFVSNLYSLTLSRPSSTRTTRSASHPGAQ
ncbi:uncharacterized protein LOC143831698 [Paroedura picta]|uniref:uncharacterized protein LOC143831698 n=1 Tax=Paroedura picta TaxID=143630 RepID=UPI004057B0E4